MDVCHYMNTLCVALLSGKILPSILLVSVFELVTRSRFHAGSIILCLLKLRAGS